MYKNAQLKLLVSLVLISGATTFWGHLEANEQYTPFDALYLTLQTAKLGTALESTTINWQLQVMRFVLPALTIFTLIVAVLLSARHWAQFKVLGFAPPEVVFLGAGRSASSLAKAFLDKDARAVALTPDTDQPYALTLKQEGAILLPGVTTDVQTLKKLQIADAKCVYIGTDDDMRNMETALAVMDIRPRPTAQKLVIRLSDKSIQATFAKHQTVKEYAAQNNVIWLDLAANAARAVIQKYPPSDGNERDGVRHVGIFGFDAFGQELLLQLVRNIVDPTVPALRVTVFSSNQNEMANFLDRHPALDPKMKDEPLYGGLTPLADIAHVVQSSEASCAVAIMKAHMHAPFSAFYIAVDADHESLAISEKIAQVNFILESKAKIICCLPGTSYENSFQVKMERGKSLGDNVEFFHINADQFFEWESFPGEALDTCGMIVNAAYEYCIEKKQPVPIDVKFELMEQTKENRAKSWLALSEEFRRSSRFSGDHIWEKLRFLGFELAVQSHYLNDSNEYTVSGLEELQEVLDKTNVEKLMRIEHQRFLIERLLDGWLCGEVRNNERRLNQSLVPFESVKEEELIKSKSIILSIPSIVNEMKRLSKERSTQSLCLYRKTKVQSITD